MSCRNPISGIVLVTEKYYLTNTLYYVFNISHCILTCVLALIYCIQILWSLVVPHFACRFYVCCLLFSLKFVYRNIMSSFHLFFWQPHESIHHSFPVRFANITSVFHWFLPLSLVLWFYVLISYSVPVDFSLNYCFRNEFVAVCI